MFNARPLLSACYALVSSSIFSTRIFRIINKFLCNLYFAWHFLFVYTDSWFIFLFRAANDLFYIYIKLDFSDGQISNHHVQLFPMVTKHRSNNAMFAMFAMYRSRLYQTLSTHFERCERISNSHLLDGHCWLVALPPDQPANPEASLDLSLETTWAHLIGSRLSDTSVLRLE